MIPVEQQFLSGPDGDGEPGDCLRACVASILEQPIDAVPNFSAFHGPIAWWEELRRWLRTGVVDACTVDSLDQIEDWGDAEHVIASVPSPRGPWLHCVVVDRDGVIVHDPYPTGKLTGRADAVEFTAICQPYEPFPSVYVGGAELELTA